ncbi:hypothetical protein IAU60_005740 [Kwoniella sp. DSM 27419]
MVVFHIVAFKTKSAEGLKALTDSFLALPKDCISPAGQPYIKIARGGRQISTEGKDHEMQVCFVMEFENEEDLDYYLYKDPVHEQFKTNAMGQWETMDVVALDFKEGAF